MFLLDLALKFWKPLAMFVAALAIALALAAMKRSYDDGKRAEGAKPVQAAFDAYVETARKRTTEITLAWDAKRIEAEQAGKVADEERAKLFAESKMRAQALPPAVAAVVVPAAALGVLDAAIDAGSAAPTPGPAGAPPAATPAAAETAAQPDGTVGLLIEWGAMAVAKYDECRDLVTGWQAFYRGLQAAQVPEP